MKKDLQYRPDIDGLRAVAVLLVVLFHAFPKTFDNGFIGVDVFFVVSGFLITGIILSGLDKNKFTFADFYGRRIRRIFPALILILITVLIFGYFNLFSHEFKQLAKHAIGGSGFISNFFFWQEAGYFDNAADTKPLLHLWSLSIEEQFYIIFPFLLFFLYKRKFNLLSIFILLWAISFSFNLYEYKKDPTADFYSPLTRFWEILTGSILAVLAHNKKTTPWSKNLSKNNSIAHIVSLLGFVLIAWGLVTSKYGLVSSKAHPGIGALLPVIGSAMIIASNGKGIINKMLSHKWLVSIGLISYPLYLWHWPILSYLTIITSNLDFGWSALHIYLKKILPSLSNQNISSIIPIIIKFLAIGFAILLSTLTYHYVEKRMRSGANKKIQTTKTIALSAIMVMIFVASFTLYKLTPKISERSGNLYQLHSFFDDLTIADQNCLDYVKVKFYTDSIESNKVIINYYCKFNDVASNRTIGLVGSSYAYASFHGMANYLATKNINTLFITNERYISNSNNQCNALIIFGFYPKDFTNHEKQQCIESEKKIIEIFVKRNIKHVFLTTYYYYDYQPMVDMFWQHNIKVYTITPFPLLTTHPRNCISKHPPYGKSPVVGCVTLPGATALQIQEIKKLKNATMIDVTPAFCPNGICSAFNEKGELLYSDRGHFSKAGSIFLTESLLAPYLDKIAEEN